MIFDLSFCFLSLGSGYLILLHLIFIGIPSLPFFISPHANASLSTSTIEEKPFPLSANTNLVLFFGNTWVKGVPSPNS